MFLFLRILLAHFIADFPLQTKKIFDLKSRNFLGITLHAFIFLVLALLFSASYINESSIWVFILGLSVSHVVIDWMKLKITEATDTNNIWAFLLDQAVHISLIMLIFLLPASKTTRPLPLGWISGLYNSDTLTASLIGLIISTYGSSFILYYIKTTFVDRKILYRRDWDGMLERGVITLLMLGGWKFILIIPVIVAVRIFYYLSFASHPKEWSDIIKRIEPPFEYQKIKLKSYLSIDLIGSPILAVLVGIFLKNLGIFL